jgi:hypothetical protein
VPTAARDVAGAATSAEAISGQVEEARTPKRAGQEFGGGGGEGWRRLAHQRGRARISERKEVGHDME